MADDKTRPEPDLVDRTKGRLVEEPGKTKPTPAERDVQQADRDLNKGGKPTSNPKDRSSKDQE